MKNFKIAVLANLKKNAPHWEGMAEDQWDDLDSEKTINAIQGALRSAGHTCEFFEGDRSLMTLMSEMALVLGPCTEGRGHGWMMFDNARTGPGSWRTLHVLYNR